MAGMGLALPAWLRPVPYAVRPPNGPYYRWSLPHRAWLVGVRAGRFVLAVAYNPAMGLRWSGTRWYGVCTCLVHPTCPVHPGGPLA